MVTRTDRYRVVVDTKDAQNSVKQLSGSLGNLKGLIGGALVVGGVAAAVQQISRVNREYETMTNQLRLVTSGQSELNSTFSELQGVSARTASELSNTVDLFTKLKISTESMGASTESVVKVTETFQKALAISGADANTASGAIRQFGQAMASGTVRGDEFNSIVEALGPALAIMARESGITIGRLREMSQAGELNSETFFKMIEGAENLDAVFASLNTTTEQTRTLLGQTFDEITNKIDKSLGISSNFREMMQMLNQDLADLFNTSQSLEALSLSDLFTSVEQGALRADIAIAELNNRYANSIGLRGLFSSEDSAAIREQIRAIEELTAARQAELAAAQEQVAADAATQAARREMLEPLTQMGVALGEITKQYERNIPASQKLSEEHARVSETLEKLLAIRDEELLQSPEYQAALEATRGRISQLDDAMAGLGTSTNNTASATRAAAREMENLKSRSSDFIADLNSGVADAELKFRQLNMDPLQRQISSIENNIKNKLAREVERLQAAMTPKNSEEIQRQIDTITAAANSAIASQAELAERSYEHQRSFSYGWSEAFREYADNASNAANTAADIFGKTTRGIEDAIVNFAKTGKFSLRDMLGDVGETLLRSNVRNIISTIGGKDGPLGGLMDSLGLGGLLGSSNTNAQRGNTAAAPIFVADVTGGGGGDLSQLGGMISAQTSGFAGLINGALGQFSNLAGQLNRGGSTVVNTGGGGNIVTDLLGGLLGGGGNTSSGIFGNISNGIKNIFSGFFANGGYIPAGNYGIVGERGPEMVMGPASVRPGASGGRNLNVTINAVDAPSFQQLVARDPEFIYSVAQRGGRSFA